MNKPNRHKLRMRAIVTAGAIALTAFSFNPQPARAQSYEQPDTFADSLDHRTLMISTVAAVTVARDICPPLIDRAQISTLRFLLIANVVKEFGAVDQWRDEAKIMIASMVKEINKDGNPELCKMTTEGITLFKQHLPPRMWNDLEELIRKTHELEF